MGVTSGVIIPRISLCSVITAILQCLAYPLFVSVEVDRRYSLEFLMVPVFARVIDGLLLFRGVWPCFVGKKLPDFLKKFENHRSHLG